MSQIIKAFTGVFLVLYMMVTATGILGCFLQTIQAQNYHAVFIDEMENSNYSPRVIQECFEAAKETGYQLELILYHQNSPYEVITQVSEVPAKIEDVKLVKVNLDYTMELAFFQIELEQCLSAYAR